jgi:hypothetical protein
LLQQHTQSNTSRHNNSSTWVVSVATSALQEHLQLAIQNVQRLIAAAAHTKQHSADVTKAAYG